MTKKIYCLFALFFFSSCISLNTINNRLHEKNLHEFIHSLIEKEEISGNLGIKVVSLVDGRTLFAYNDERLMTPASNIKLFTSAASLHYMKKEHVFETTILKQKNNIILIGGGDPELSLQVIDSLAYLVSKEVERIDTLFIDGGLFDNFHFGKGWMWDEGSEKYSAPISALSVNNNCIDFEYSPNELGLPAKIKISPNTKFVRIINNSMTVNDTINFKKLKIDRDWVGGTNDYLITGEILKWSGKDTVKKNIEKPNLFAGTVFRESLESHGLSVNRLQLGKKIESKDTILVHQSKPLYILLENMMHDSKNLTSELLLKYMGITDSSVGTWESGIQKVKTYLFEEVNIDTSALRIADGSGLSRYNLLTANQIVKLLTYIHGREDRDLFLNTLPYGNEKDTRLEGRLIEVQNKVYAKTGSLSGVSCLSGYALSPSKGPMAFSILINGFVGSIRPHRKFQDEICNWLVTN